MIKINQSVLNSNIKTGNSLFYNTLRIFVTLGFPFILVPYISRVFSVEQIGVYNWSLSLVNYLIIITGVSFPIIGIRELSKAKKQANEINSIITDILYVRIILFLIAFSFTLGVVLMTNKFSDNSLIILILSTLIIFEILAHEWIFISYGNYRSILIRSFISKLVLIILTFVFVKGVEDLILFVCFYSFSMFLSSFLGFNYLFTSFKPNLHKANFFRYFSMDTLKSFFLNILMSFYGKLDILLIAIILSPRDLGLFSNAYKIIVLALVFITSWTMVLLPKSVKNKDNDEDFNKIINWSIDLVLVFGIYFSINIIIFSKSIISIIFGDNFIDATIFLQLLAPIIVLISVYNVIVYQVLFAKDIYKEVLRFFTAVYIIGVLGIFFLYSWIGLNGAILVLIFMNLIQLVIAIYYLVKRTSINIFNLNKLKILIGAVMLVLFGIATKYFNIEKIPEIAMFICISIFVFFGVLLLLKENILLQIVKLIKLNYVKIKGSN
jgi:O-antigen/teichoic acid export membrane protein